MVVARKKKKRERRTVNYSQSLCDTLLLLYFLVDERIIFLWLA